MTRYLIEGFALGLSTGLTCIASCGPVYTPFLMQQKHSMWQSFVMLLKISVGRFFSYLAFGILAGMLGYQIGTINRPWFTAAAYVLFSVMLIVSAFRTNRKEKGCALKKWGRFADNPYILGLLTGINFCPSFLIALTRAVDISGPVSGGLLFGAFFFGTNLYLFPLVIFGVMGNKLAFRKIAIISSVLVGAWFIGLAGWIVYNNIFSAKPEISQNDIVSLLDSTPAYVLSSDTVTLKLFADTLRQNRKGFVFISSDTSQIPDSCHIFVANDFWATDSNDNKLSVLRRPGRFVVVLPEATPQKNYDQEYAHRVISFLSGYTFKVNHEKGTFFSMTHFASYKEIK